MFSLSRRFWADDHGFIVSAELVLIATVGVIGLVAGLTCVRDAITGELGDVARSIGSLNQSYCYSGMRSYKCNGVKAFTAGSSFVDLEDSDGEAVAFDCLPEYREVIPQPLVVPYVEQEVIPCPPVAPEALPILPVPCETIPGTPCDPVPAAPILPAPGAQPCCEDPVPEAVAPSVPCPPEAPCATPAPATPVPCCGSHGGPEFHPSYRAGYPAAVQPGGYFPAPVYYGGRPVVW